MSPEADVCLRIVRKEGAKKEVISLEELYNREVKGKEVFLSSQEYSLWGIVPCLSAKSITQV